jgi:hypothetical protein
LAVVEQLLVLTAQTLFLQQLLAQSAVAAERIQIMDQRAVLVAVAGLQLDLEELELLIKVTQVALLHHLPVHSVPAAAAVQVLLVVTKQVVAQAVTVAQEFSRQLLDHLLNALAVVADLLKVELKQPQLVAVVQVVLR